MILLSEVKPGDKVHYKPRYYQPGKFKNGIIKSVPWAVVGRPAEVFVVYDCNDDWDDYQNYTAASTKCKDLYPGWREKYITLP